VLAARRELNETQRAVLLRRADSIAFVDAPMMFLYFYNELYAAQPWVHGFLPPVIFNGQRWLDVTMTNGQGSDSTRRELSSATP
jgi:peptide/nickel transport system substrate-binding protein/oligopeptide transport system substrate-binding protein